MPTSRLADVPRAFGWLSAYYKEVSKLCDRIRSEVEQHPNGYECLSGTGIDWATSKVITRPLQWFPTYHYQFFARPIEEGGKRRALLAICIQHFIDGKNDDPIVYLVRFEGGVDDVYSEKKGAIVYAWDITGDEEERDGWRLGSSQELQYAYRCIPLDLIDSLDAVRPTLIDPLVEFDRAQGA